MSVVASALLVSLAGAFAISVLIDAVASVAEYFERKAA